MSGKTVLETHDLTKRFPVRSGILQRVKHHVHAVSKVSLKIDENETLGLVGESGSGKSTLGRLIMRLLQPDSGKVIFDGMDISDLRFSKMTPVRKGMQMIFQDPLDSLNSRLTIEQIISEPLDINRVGDKASRRKRVLELLEVVGLRKRVISRYPHEFSGGQRQRIGIARALALSPKLIIADEPVSALDVSIQAQILNLMVDLQKEFGIGYLFIAHDIHVIHFIADRIAVMYLGKVVEIGPSRLLKKSPKHPYTQALFKSVPYPDPKSRQKFEAIKGEIPSLINPPSGCAFHTRCPYAQQRCLAEVPQLRSISEKEHFISCHFDL